MFLKHIVMSEIMVQVCQHKVQKNMLNISASTKNREKKKEKKTPQEIPLHIEIQLWFQLLSE